MCSELVFPNIRSPEHVFDVCGATVVWGRAPVWELRPTMGAAWELHLAAAFDRPGAALKTHPGAASMAGMELQLGAAPARRQIFPWELQIPWELRLSRCQRLQNLWELH